MEAINVSLTAAELEILLRALLTDAARLTNLSPEFEALAALNGRLLKASDELILAAHEAATNGRKGGR